MNRPPAPTSRRAQQEGLIGIGVVLMVGFAGALVFAASLGLVESDDTPGVFARIVMFGFGGVLLGVSGFLAWRITAELVDLSPKDHLGIVVRVLRETFERVEFRSVVSALLLAPLVWAFLTPRALAGWWRPSAEALIALIPLEFLLIHGFPFLVFVALLVRGTAGWARGIWVAVMLLLLLMYGALAWQEAGGVYGLLGLLWLIAPNILAFLRSDDAWHFRVAAVARWLLRLVVFFGLAILIDERSLRGEGNLRLGALYFSAILVLELFRVFELPLDIADKWAELPESRRRSLLPPST